MLKASLMVAVSAISYQAMAYTGPVPGDLALGDNMCHDVVDTTLKGDKIARAAGHHLCDRIADCRANHSQNNTDLNDCVNNARREYAARLHGASPRHAAAQADGDKAVVTDAENFRYYHGEEGRKGMKDGD